MTSATGAALRDVLNVLRRRSRGVSVLVYPVPVQGAGAAREIAAMLAIADRRREVDLLLLVRGGGSLEDLFAFNDESLARAIAALELPLVTGIGHEVDFTIADFVADLRAPTPSAAAELAVPDASRLAGRARRDGRHGCGRRWRARSIATATAYAQLRRRLGLLHPARALREHMQRLDELQARLAGTMRRESRARLERLLRIGAELAVRSPAARLAALHQRIAHAGARLLPAVRGRLAGARGLLQSATRGLEATSPLATLGRGYAIVTLAADGTVLRDPARAAPGVEIEARLAHGQLRARVLGPQALSQRRVRRLRTLARASLARCQLVAPPRERVVLAAQVDAHRRAVEAERLAEAVRQVATVVFRRTLGLRPVHHDDRRVAAALVRVAKPDPPAAHERRLVLPDRRLEHARELRRRHLPHRSRVRGTHRVHQVADAAAVQCRDVVDRRESRGNAAAARPGRGSCRAGPARRGPTC